MDIGKQVCEKEQLPFLNLVETSLKWTTDKSYGAYGLVQSFFSPKIKIKQIQVSLTINKDFNIFPKLNVIISLLQHKSIRHEIYSSNENLVLILAQIFQADFRTIFPAMFLACFEALNAGNSGTSSNVLNYRIHC